MDKKQQAKTCAKAAYKDRETARTAALLAKKRYGRKLKAYQCANCCLWHLASDYEEELEQ